MQEDSDTQQVVKQPGFVRWLAGHPRLVLMLLAAWSILAAVTQVFVNSGVFLDIHDAELDGALGGFALNFASVPLAAAYIYCVRSPGKYPNIFWLAVIHQVSTVAGVIYEWIIGTYSGESIIIPVAGSAFLAVVALLQTFEPEKTPAPSD